MSTVKKHWRWIAFVTVLVSSYLGLVALLGFENIAIPNHFARVALVTAGFILFVREIAGVFHEIPAPRRDYLLAGIICNSASGLGFSLWNETSRLFDVDSNVFTSPVAGFFSLLLTLSYVFFILAVPGYEGEDGNWFSRHWKTISIVIGCLVGLAIALVAPMFR